MAKADTVKILKEGHYSFDSFPIAKAIVNRNLDLLENNSHFITLFEISISEINEEVFRILFHESVEKLKKHILKDEEKGFLLPVQLKTGIKKYIHIKSLKNPEKDTDENHIYLIFFEVTEYQRHMYLSDTIFDQVLQTNRILEKDLTRSIQDYKNSAVMMKKIESAHDILKKDLELAIVLQKSLLPETPASAHWEFTYVYLPMVGVSGDIIDFYNFSEEADENELKEKLGVLLLDASGHGVSAALITAIARPLFYKSHRAYRQEDLASAMMETNQELCREIGALPNYLTGLSVRLEENYFTYVNAGHPHIFFKRDRRNKVYELKNDGILLGVKEFGGDFTSRRFKVEKNDIICLYTDGLTEAKKSDNEEFGEERLKQVIRESEPEESVEELRERIIQSMIDFGVDMNKPTDDVTFILIKKK